MANKPDIEFYHSPNTRSSGVRVLLEELGVPYRLHALNMRAGEHLRDAYRAINPMAKVPAIRHGEALVTEQAAVYLYLADLFPEAGLAPAATDPARATYLRWMVFYGSCYEPAVIDRHLKREPGPRGLSAYADYDSVIAGITGALTPGPYLLALQRGRHPVGRRVGLDDGLRSRRARAGPGRLCGADPVPTGVPEGRGGGCAACRDPCRRSQCRRGRCRRGHVSARPDSC